MKLDRSLQKHILEKLVECYPRAYGTRIQSFAPDLDVEKINSNIAYLQSHGLLEVNISEIDDDYWINPSSLKITARGIDFLQDDGGLSAILGTVTVRLHADTIKDLVEARITGSTMPEPEKKRFIDTLRSLPAEATKHLTMKLIDIGLEKTPSIGELIKLVT